MSSGTDIILVGGGTIGRAMASCWVNVLSLGPVRLHVVDPQVDARTALGEDSLCHYRSPDDLPDNLPTSVVVFAVKPQLMAQVVPPYRRFLGEAVFVSVAAGVRIASLQAVLGPSPIVRAMPNVAASIGKSTSILFRNAHTSPAQMSFVSSLFAAIGSTHIVNSEDLLDRLTAVTGSGPAYVFYFIESLTRAAMALGIDAGLAFELSRDMVAGAAELCARSSMTAQQLRESVSSPNGTTVAALDILSDGEAFENLLCRAVQAASERATELSALI